MIAYEDFELYIERTGDTYTAKVRLSPAGQATSTFTLPFSRDRLELLIVKLGGTRSNRRGLVSPGFQAARELGGALFKAVFSGEVHETYKSSLEKVSEKRDTGLRLKLCLQGVPDLDNVPWEFLLDAGLDRFLSQSNQTPIVRYLEIPEKIRPVQVELPLQVLVLISSPSDYIPLNVERELKNLGLALDVASKAGKMQMTVLKNPTISALQRTLRLGRYHILHYIGHGGFDSGTEEGVLLLVDEEGKGFEVSAKRMGAMLHDHPSLRLAVLNSCEGARNSTGDPFAGVASTLIRQGIPAVVAMQFEITDDAAITFSTEFYATISDGFAIDTAVAEARKAVFNRPNDIEWGTPVLFLRAENGVLFDIKTEPIAVPAVTNTKITPATTPTVIPASNTTPTTIPATWDQPGLSALAVSPDGTQLATGYRDGLVQCWNISDQSLVWRQETFKTEIKCLAFAADDGTCLAAGTKHKGLSAFNADGTKWNELLESQQDFLGSVGGLAFTPDGSLFLAARTDERGKHTTTIFQMWDGKAQYALGHDEKVTTLVISADSKFVAIGSEDGQVSICVIEDGRHYRTIKPKDGPVKKLIFSSRGEDLYCLTDKKVSIFSLANTQPPREIDIKLAQSMAIDPDKQWLIVGCGFPIFEYGKTAAKRQGNAIQVWDLGKNKLVKNMENFLAPVSFVEMTKGRVLAGTREGQIVLLDLDL